jgi:predicted AlkP superfamily pyrophosphatase or phosphodiesterase
MVSIDGLRPELVLQADRHGLEIPVLRGLLREGSYAREVVNVNPTVTNPNHTTLVTGVLPAEHGIYNNRPFEPSEKGAGPYRAYSQIKVPTLWGAAKAAGLTTGSLFWPVTEGAGDIDFNLRNGSEEDDLKIGDDAIALIAGKRPEFLTIHFVSLDHASHEHGPDGPEAKAALERIDTVLGRVIAAERRAYPDAAIVVVSDHGFSALSHQVNLNAALVEAGFITLDDDGAVDSWMAFAWYVGGSAMVVLRDPSNISTRTRLATCLEGLARDPRSGVEHVYDRTTIKGLGLSPQAEFIVALKPGYRMGTSLKAPLVTRGHGGGHGAFSTRTVRPDMHSAFFVTGPGISAGEDLGVIDMRQIAPTVARLLGVALPSARLSRLPLGDR